MMAHSRSRVRRAGLNGLGLLVAAIATFPVYWMILTSLRRGVDIQSPSPSFVPFPVTLDNYDYIFAAAYDRALSAGNTGLTAKICDEYVRYMDAVVGFYDQQAPAIVGREITHTLLLHAHALNAATLDSLVTRLRARGYRFVTLAQALSDPAYASADEYYGPAGISWLHRWGLTRGYGGATFAGEPVVPAWVHDAAAVR